MGLKLAGGRTIRADREAVWVALHDTACLKLCVPGCLALERVSETRFRLDVRIQIGLVSLAFSGKVDITDQEPPFRLNLKGGGDGGFAGLAEGTARFSLTEGLADCHLAYVVEIEPSGPFAIVGLALLGGVARELVERFSTAFAAIVEAPATTCQPAQALRPSGRTS